MEIEKLFVSLALDAAKYSQGLSDAQKEGASWSQRMKSSIGGGLQTAAKIGGAALLGVGVAIAGVAAKGVMEFANFQGSMNEVFTLMPGVTQEAMDDMSDQVLTFSKDFAVLPEKVVPALYQSLSAGVPPDNVFEFLETAQKAAIGGVTELETAVDGITSVVNAYGSDVLSAANASDVMFTAVRLGKTDFEQLSASLFNVIPTASSLGIGFGDVAAQLAVMTAQGTPTSVATTQIRSAMVEASKSGTKLSDAIQDLTGKSFAELIQSGETMPGIFETLRQSMPEQDFKDLFGSVEAMNAALGVTGPNFDTVSAAMDEMANSAGATDAAYDTMNQGIGRTMERFKAFANVALIQVGDALSPIIDKVLELAEQALPFVEAALADVTGFLEGFFSNLESGQDIITAVFDAFLTWTGIGESLSDDAFQFVLDLEAGVRSLWEQLQILWLNVQPVIDVITTAVAEFVSWKDILIAVALLIGGLVLNAIIGIVTAIAPVIIAVVAVIAIVALLRNAWENNWGGIQEKTQAVIQFIQMIITTVMTAIQAFWAEHGDAIKAKAQEIWTAIQTAVNTVITTIDNTIRTIMTALRTFWEQHGEAILAKAQEIWTAIQTAIETVLSVIESIWLAFQAAREGDWHTFGEKLREAWDTAWNAIITALEAFWVTIKETFSTAIANVIEFFKTTDWAGVGTNIVQGIADGITAGASFIADAASSAAAAALDAAKGFLGIDSPSRVAADLIGRPFTQGIAAGIEKANGVVDSAIEGVLNRAISGTAVNALVGAGVSNNNSRSYHSETTVQMAPGQDPLRALRASRHLDKLGRGAG